MKKIKTVLKSSQGGLWHQQGKLALASGGAAWPGRFGPPGEPALKEIESAWTCRKEVEMEAEMDESCMNSGLLADAVGVHPQVQHFSSQFHFEL